MEADELVRLSRTDQEQWRCALTVTASVRTSDEMVASQEAAPKKKEYKNLFLPALPTEDPAPPLGSDHLLY